MIPKKYWHKLGLIEGAPEPDVGLLRTWLPYIKTNKYAPCDIHKKCCTLPVSDLARVTSPCQGHSSLGTHQYDNDKRMKYFFMWCAFHKTMQFKLAISENVLSKGIHLYEEIFPEYVLVRLLTDAAKKRVAHQARPPIHYHDIPAVACWNVAIPFSWCWCGYRCHAHQ